MLILPNDPGRALQLLSCVAQQRVHCTAVVFADTPHAREAASRADVRAENHPFRKVVWMPEPAVIAGVPEYAELAAACASGATIAFLSFSFRVVTQLAGDAAVRFIPIERGFLAAQTDES